MLRALVEERRLGRLAGNIGLGIDSLLCEDLDEGLNVLLEILVKIQSLVHLLLQRVRLKARAERGRQSSSDYLLETYHNRRSRGSRRSRRNM